MDPDSIDEEFLIKSANASTNVLGDAQITSLTFSGKSGNPGHVFDVRCHNHREVSKTLCDKMFEMFAENMEPFYRSSSWGWNEKERKKEFNQPLNRYLVASNPVNDELAGFCMFRFEYDDDEEPEHPVLYLYELQIKSDYRGQGIGCQLMEMVKKISQHFRMWKVMLTVFKSNHAAMSFYEKMGFGVDVNSPSRCGYKNECYEILSDIPNKL